ncbi:MAG: hypothetical protein GXY19_12135 [Phycisphaerae bacterium]|nr:hypothetical protein [Phycisphaerae bacterium]
MIVFGSIALVGFWYLVVRLWFFGGPKVPLLFIGLWVLAFVAVGTWELGGHVFVGIEAVLALSLIVICGFREPL